MINRETYIDKIIEFIDKPFVKIITGIRRSGKSTVLMLLVSEFQKRGVDKEQIVYINFESFDFSHINEATHLYNYVKEKINHNKRFYIILDEIQEVNEWEKAVNSFLVDFNVDIYITGSNSHLLSSELATLLTGRYIEFHVYTLSFKESLLFKQQRNVINPDISNEFELFLRTGGFPVLYTSDYSLDAAYKIVYDIYSSAILRDTIQRNNIRDIELLERVVKFVLDNIGNKFSGKNVADYFKSQYRKIDINTVYNYLNALESAFIIHRISRFDVKGKEILKTQEKFYVADTAILYAVMGYKDRLIAGVLENIVMLELKRRGYSVFVGKLDTVEIDFVAQKANEVIYLQVAYQLAEQTTIEREIKPLLQIKDNYPKYIISMDKTWKDNIQGIKQEYIADFLLNDNF